MHSTADLCIPTPHFVGTLEHFVFEPGPGLGPSPGWGPVRVGAHMGPYGPIYGPIWAHVGPYGSSWTGLGDSVNFPSTFRKLSVRLLDKFRTFRVQKWYFDEISK